ncbi:MAG: Ig-like domain-containing protein [Candidatus Aenigmarchaeota archaeon]|nr:Ig-like domain-containing protein [Candidatus Aenigmarchaeota archaeon]
MSFVPGVYADTIIENRFNGGYDGWSYYYESFEPGWWYPWWPSTNGYSMSLSNDGSSPPSVLLSGDGWVSYNGMQKTINLPEARGEIIISYDWRASSGFAGSTVTNSNIKILDTSGNILYSEPVFPACYGCGTYDTGWRHYSRDITQYVSGKDGILVKIYMHDAWIANWGERSWYDNILIENRNPPAADLPPTVSVGAEQPILVGSPFTVTANATDDKGLSKIEVFIDNTTSKTCAASGLLATCDANADPYETNGTHSYYAVATDNMGQNSTSIIKQFTVELSGEGWWNSCGETKLKQKDSMDIETTSKKITTKSGSTIEFEITLNAASCDLPARVEVYLKKRPPADWEFDFDCQCVKTSKKSVLIDFTPGSRIAKMTLAFKVPTGSSPGAYQISLSARKVG